MNTMTIMTLVFAPNPTTTRPGVSVHAHSDAGPCGAAASIVNLARIVMVRYAGTGSVTALVPHVERMTTTNMTMTMTMTKTMTTTMTMTMTMNMTMTMMMVHTGGPTMVVTMMAHTGVPTMVVTMTMTMMTMMMGMMRTKMWRNTLKGTEEVFMMRTKSLQQQIAKEIANQISNVYSHHI